MPILAIFDFDYTVTEDNTDSSYWHLLDQNFKKQQYNKFNNDELTWHQLCNSYMRSINYEDLIETIKNIKLTTGMVELWRKIKSSDPGSKIIIASDSNTEFIKEILKKHALTDLVDEIHTNGFDKNTITITNYEVAFNAKRDKECPNNCHKAHMCKGDITRKLIKKYVQNTMTGQNNWKIFFAGDGSNDFCGMCAVRDSNLSGKLALGRKGPEDGRGFGLERVLAKKGVDFQGEKFVNFWWKNGDDIIECLAGKDWI